MRRNSSSSKLLAELAVRRLRGRRGAHLPGLARWCAAQMPTADFVLKVASVVALAVGALWAVSQFIIGGGTNWAVNLSIDAEILKYRDSDGLALLVGHVKSKLAGNTRYEFSRGDRFVLQLRELPMNLPGNGVIREDDGVLLQTANLLPDGGYAFMPGYEGDDMAAFVVRGGQTLSLKVELGRGEDYVSATKVVRIP